MKKLSIFIALIVFFWCQLLLAQDTLRTKVIENDSLKAKDDTLYKKIELKTQKNKFTQKIHELLFSSIKEDIPSAPIQKKEKRPWKPFQGKVIRKIYIDTYDPLGYDERDNSKQPDKWERLGNVFHNKTKNKVIKRLLLFNNNMPLDSTKVTETERVLRSQYYIRRVRIIPLPTQSKDSVDISVSILDSWSLYADADGSLKHGTIRVFERNFLGYGHQVSARYSQEFSGNARPSFGFDYEIPNIYASTLNTAIGYSFDFDKHYYKYWSLTRPYYSIYTRWAGGINVYSRTFEDTILKSDSLYHQNFKIAGKGVWGSVSFPILKKYTPTNHITKLVLSLRHYQIDYLKAPSSFLDEHHFYSSRDIFLASIGINYFGYEQDRYIFRHRDIEDIPIGKSLTFLWGAQQKLGKMEPYLGGKIMYADYFSLGYFSGDVQLGSFFSNKDYKQTTLKWEFTYFSPLFHLGKWNFRQFGKWRSVIGLSRIDYVKDRVTLNGRTGIMGFDSPTLSGTHKSIFTAQTQSYSPFSIWGFRVSPFLTTDVGFIGEPSTSFFKDQVFTKFGIGFYITNDYIPLGNFQFSFIFMPRVPGVGNGIQKFMGIGNTDFRLPNFNYSVPELIRYE